MCQRSLTGGALGNPLNSGVTLSFTVLHWVLFAWTSELKEQQGEVPKSLEGKFLQHSWIMEGIIFGLVGVGLQAKARPATLPIQPSITKSPGSIVYIFPSNSGVQTSGQSLVVRRTSKTTKNRALKTDHLRKTLFQAQTPYRFFDIYRNQFT